MRNDLRSTEGHKVRTGKLIVQGAHASNGAILPYVGTYQAGADEELKRELVLTWLADSFTKVCVRVNSEEHLMEVYEKAKAAGMIACLITDNGTTEFGEPTVTCCAIGPDTEEALAPITGDLKLL